MVLNTNWCTFMYACDQRLCFSLSICYTVYCKFVMCHKHGAQSHFCISLTIFFYLNWVEALDFSASTYMSLLVTHSITVNMTMNLLFIHWLNCEWFIHWPAQSFWLWLFVLIHHPTQVFIATMRYHVVVCIKVVLKPE